MTRALISETTPRNCQKLLPSHFNLSNGQVSQNYSYHNDGRLSFVQNTMDVNFDRAYSYDHAARLTEAKSGGHARGDSGATPYSEYFGHGALSNLIMRSTLNWGQDEFLDSALTCPPKSAHFIVRSRILRNYQRTL